MVFVDELRSWPGVKKPRCFRRGSCHLTADTLIELELMARSLGLRREWFQSHPKHPHYDLTPERRVQAVQLGAVELSAKDQARRRRARFRRLTDLLPTPGRVVVDYRELELRAAVTVIDDPVTGPPLEMPAELRAAIKRYFPDRIQSGGSGTGGSGNGTGGAT